MPSRGERKIASKVKPRPPLEINGVAAPPGKLTQTELRVARLPTGIWLSFPVGVLHGARPGPVIWVTGAIHGDELNGVPIIRRILDVVDPRTLQGTLLAVPVVNVFGLVKESRYLPDRRDLNRSFPGSKRGSTAAQLANLLMTEIVARSEVGIDLHTGSGGRKNLPQVRCDLDDDATLRLATAFGAPMLLHARLRDGSLRAAATALGKAVLLYEAGEANRFDSNAIETGVHGVLRVMRALGMIDVRIDPPSQASRTSRSSAWSRAQRTGFCEMRVQLGAEVEAGAEIAIVYDTLGQNRAIVRAGKPGVVIGHVTSPIVHRGDAVAHVAQIED